MEAEYDLAPAGLHELLRPVFGCLGELPEIQSQALRARWDSRRLRMLIACSSRPRRSACSRRPQRTVPHCVVDDAQWLDRPSADALVFTARRLRAERLAILFAARDSEVTMFEAAGLPQLALADLGPEPAAAILATSARQAVPSVQTRLLAKACGNPLALLELPDGLSEEQLDGHVPLPDAMPLTPASKASSSSESAVSLARPKPHC